MYQLIGLLVLLTAGPVYAASLSLTWTDNSDNETGFSIERREGQTGVFTSLEKTSANVILYKDGTVKPETEYCYRVRAFNAAGKSDWSNTACRTVVGLPASPSNALVLQIETKVTIIIRTPEGSTTKGGK